MRSLFVGENVYLREKLKKKICENADLSFDICIWKADLL